jgi:hypothetical protein
MHMSDNKLYLILYIYLAVDICAKLFQNPSMYDKVTVRTRMQWDRRCDYIMPLNRGHLLVMTNQYVKYEDFVIKSFQNNKGKRF